MGMSKRDSDCRREHWPDSPKRNLPVFTLPGFLKIEQKLSVEDGQTASPLGLKGLPERRIGRWNYTIVPWED
jgi:hypothetical protein